MLRKFTNDISCVMNVAQPMCVTLTTNDAVVLSKVANVCLDLDSNIVLYSDLRVVSDLAALIVLGMDWLTAYNPAINWQMLSVSLDCTCDIAAKEHAHHTIYSERIYYAS